MKVSVVIPTYRSAENLPILLERLCGVLLSENPDYEIIVVDDNSPDNTLTYLKEASLRQTKIKVISLARNFGQQLAIGAGLKYANGDAVIVMDDDLQDPPEFVPALIEKWKEGYDVVYAVKTNRSEGLLKKTGYKLFYRILTVFSDTPIPQNSGDFCIMSKRVVTILNGMNERDRLVRGLRAWVGFKQIGLEYKRGKRHSGNPAYTFSKMIRLALDGIFSFSNKPLKFSFWLGFLLSFFAFAGILTDLSQRIALLVNPDSKFSMWRGFSPVLLIVLLIGGIQLISIGIVGEYIGRIYNEIRQRPVFLIKESIGIEGIENN